MKELTIIFFSSWKFAATFPIAIYAMGMSFTETILYTNIGGVLGTFISIYFSDFLIKMWNKYWPEKLKFRRKTRKKFTKRNRRLVKIKLKYGLFGIVILSPVILSIPLGSFLTVKYYGIKKKNIIWLLTGQFVWSFVYTLFYIYVKTIFI
jgi:intein/homing endonuclease